MRSIAKLTINRKTKQDNHAQPTTDSRRKFVMFMANALVFDASYSALWFEKSDCLYFSIL